MSHLMVSFYCFVSPLDYGSYFPFMFKNVYIVDIVEDMW